MERYSIIHEKSPREIVLLRGKGCAYLKCTFCDYHIDKSLDDDENYKLNAEVLKNVTGEYGNLEVINSGSVFELDERTLSLIEEICREKEINTLHFESHYCYRERIPELRKRFCGMQLKMKLGLETFDYDFRENVLHKGISEIDPKVISEHFNEANFLFGINGQTVESMRKDIEQGLEYFERICINIMCSNTTSVEPDKAVIDKFVGEIYSHYKDNPRVDILMFNTDFGVGGESA